MAQQIQQGNIFGRLGTGIGQGMAEQIPKEIERNRMVSGLQSFEKDYQNLSPIQQLARLSAIPGVTPQTIQSFQELAKIQNQRNAFANRPGMPQSASAGVNSAQFQTPNLMQGGAQQGTPNQQFMQGQGQQQQMQQQPGAQQQQGAPNQRQFGGPQIAPNNPLAAENLPPKPWPPERRDAVVNDYMDRGFTPNQSYELAAEDEAKEMQSLERGRQANEQLKDTRQDVRGEFDKQLEERLQKRGDQVFADISGDYKEDIKRNMERDLASNPNASVQDVAEKWTKVALRAAESKNRAAKLIATTGIENFAKGDSEINKLTEIGKTMQELGASKDFYNLLRSEGGMSSQGAATLAYQPSKAVKDYISKFKGTSNLNIGSGPFGVAVNKVTPEQTSRKAAIEIGSKITPNDSLLTIARELSNKYPQFDQTAFFAQMSEDKDNLGLNSRQRDEIAEGPKDIIPSWGDVLLTKFKSFVGK